MVGHNNCDALRWFSFVHENNSLFGGAVGATLTAILLGLKQFIGTSRLYLDFKNGQDAYLSESTHVEGEERVTRKYLRVSVKATGIFGLRFGGSSGARKCRIYVTSIQPIKDGATQNDHIYDARPISWPPDKDFEPRDIPRGLTFFANVVTMKQHHLAWAFQLPDTYGLKPELLGHPSTMRICVTATADNAKPVSIYILASINADKLGFEAHKE